MSGGCLLQYGGGHRISGTLSYDGRKKSRKYDKTLI